MFFYIGLEGFVIDCKYLIQYIHFIQNISMLTNLIQ